MSSRVITELWSIWRFHTAFLSTSFIYVVGEKSKRRLKVGFPYVLDTFLYDCSPGHYRDLDRFDVFTRLSLTPDFFYLCCRRTIEKKVKGIFLYDCPAEDFRYFDRFDIFTRLTLTSNFFYLCRWRKSRKDFKLKFSYVFVPQGHLGTGIIWCFNTIFLSFRLLVFLISEKNKRMCVEVFGYIFVWLSFKVIPKLNFFFLFSRREVSTCCCFWWTCTT